MAEEKKGKMTVAEAGRKGGQRTSQTRGREFYQEIGHKGGEKVKEKYGSEFYSRIGRKGGESSQEREEGRQPEGRIEDEAEETTETAR
jgi:general stress protein YciG